MTKAADLANLIGNINAGGGGVNRNVIINGAMNVAQRSTSEAVLGGNTDTYRTVDRWKIATNGTAGRFTMSQDSSAPSGFANSTKFDCTTADTSLASNEYFIFRQIIEAQNCKVFAKGTSDAKPFVLSFYVKGNASATYVAELVADDVTRAISKSFSVTTDWTRVELTYPADTTGEINDDNGIGLYLNIWLHAGSTYSGGSSLSTTWGSITHNERAVGISSFFDSTDRTFFITGVQLEVGQNATEFEHEPIERTLSKCQRYFHSIGGDGDYERFALGYHHDSTQARCLTFFPVAMRAVPTTTKADTLIVANRSSSYTVTSIAVDYNNKTIGHIQYNIGSSSLNVGEGCHIVSYNNTTSRLNFDAEL